MQQQQGPGRVPTGVGGLDTILRGGLIRGGGYLLIGWPGAGKTILSNQICFTHVASGGRALYVTVLAESHTRMLGYLRSMAFFDEEPVGSSLVYFSGYATVQESGLRGLLELLRSEVRSQGATLLVIDGLSTLEAVAESYLDYKRFVSDLQASLDMLGCTTILQAQPGQNERSTIMHTIVDGVILLLDHRVGLSAVREIEVQKLRGSDSLRGRHQFEISSAGITVYPRTEAVYALPLSEGPHSRRRVRFESPRLDEMLHGGLLSGTATLVIGPPGSGKTLLGLQLLAAGARSGEKGLYFGFYEGPDDLVEKADGIGLRMSELVHDGGVEIIWQPPIENRLDAFAERLLEAVRQGGVQRLVIDSLRSFEQASVYPERMTPFLAALTAQLRALNVTTLFTVTLDEPFGPSISIPVSAAEVSDNLVLLRYVEQRARLYRLLSLLKVRDSAFEPAAREFTIGANGFDVAPTSESAEQILTGRVRPERTRRGRSG